MGANPHGGVSSASPGVGVWCRRAEQPTYCSDLVGARGRGWGAAGGCGADKGPGGFGGPRSSLAQPQPPRSCWPAITSHYSLPGSGAGLNAAAFSWLLASTEEETLLSGDNHRGEPRNPGPGAHGQQRAGMLRLTGRWGARRGRLPLAAAWSSTPDYSLMGLGIILGFSKSSRTFHPQTHSRVPRLPGRLLLLQGESGELA